MKQVVFWSRRGGAGRTMALANIAVILADNGKVVVRDTNDDGTLHRYFGGKKYDAPFTKHGVTYVDPHDQRYATAKGADFELINTAPGVRCDTPYDILVPVLTPSVHRPREVADWVYPSSGKVLPFLSRIEDANEHDLSKHWRKLVMEAFTPEALTSDHYYGCATPEYPYWSFFHETEPVAAAHYDRRSWTAPMNICYGYKKMAEAIKQA